MRLTLSVAACLLSLTPAAALACSYALGVAHGEYSETDLPTPVAQDGAAPSAAEVSLVQVNLVIHPRSSDGASCPSLDSLRFRVDGGDAETRRSELFVAAYVAPDAVALAAKTQPDLYFRLDPYSAAPLRGRESDIYEGATHVNLGQSIGRERDGAPFRSPDPYCFQVAIRDRAGQLGPRSEAVCLDTTDENGPYARIVDAAPPGFGCGGFGYGPVPATLMLAAVLGAAGTRRRKAATK